MQTIIDKTRDLISDILKTDGRDCFVFEAITSSKIFTLTEANVDSDSIIVNKNGAIIPVVNATWTRAGTVITITKTAHGLINNDKITVTISNSVLALPLGIYTITKIDANTFTVVGLNAGLTTGGTCTYNNYSYSSTTGKITIVGTLTPGDSLEIDYSYYSKYSDNELRGFIKSAITYLAVEKYGTFAIKSDNIIFPTPNEGEENLIALIASILIKGDIVSYRTPEISMTFERGDSKEIKIRKFIRQYKKTYGILTYINLGEKIVYDVNED